MSDRHLRRDGDDYGTELLLLLPDGQAWPKEPGATLDLACRGLAFYYGTVDGRAGDLLEIESDPTKASELLPDWERNWALPDACEVRPPTAEQARRDELMFKMTLLGQQDRQFFIDWAARRGETVTIREYAPYMCGISRVGDTRVGVTALARTPPPAAAHRPRQPVGTPFSLPAGLAYGTSTATAISAGTRVSVGAAVGHGTAIAKPANVAGDITYDSYFRWQLGPRELRYYWLVDLEHVLTGIECIFTRYKPGHSDVVFTYRSKLDRAISLYSWLMV